MKQTLCDLCKKDVTQEDIRYIDITKLVEDRENGGMTSKPTKTALEICTICAEEAYKRIVA